MKIIMIWGQRKCRYPGQYAPELLEAMSEYADDDNPSIIDNSYKQYSNYDDFESVRVIEAEIDDNLLDEILTPKRAKIALKNTTEGDNR